ncbi:LysR substrate-binding domain-containing protein [Aestuariivita sp.]|jgi:LysR family glycine cleavage system transcriptional activator|uniref:LysR substrate-binding domain-containing protein n=1 Tax=Aestuariivita sp. TaxID=1872407 RepID=UPI0025C3808C|nr:LysR substrate-binding domain-containing protein [Aestuariivita sp.]
MTAALPGIDLHVEATDRVTGCHGDGIDLAVRQGQGPFPASLTATRLFRTEVIALCAPILMPPGADRMPRDLFLNHTRLHDSHELQDRYLELAFGADTAENRAASLHFSWTALCLDAAQAGHRIALAARFLVARDLRDGRLVQARPDRLEISDGFHLLAPRRLGASARALAQWLNGQAESGV